MNRLLPTLLIAALCLSVFPSAVRADGVRNKRPNMIAGELGGRGTFLGAGYERYFTNYLGAGVSGGLGAWAETVFAVVPVYATGIWGNHHGLYGSAGAALVLTYSQDEGVFRYPFGTISLGYQYHAEGGFFVRPTVSLLFNSAATIPWGGVSIGGSF